MIWQDYALTFIIFMFAWGLIPQIKDVFKKRVILNLWTAFLTTIGNYVCMIIWLTLPTPLWISIGASFTVGTAWLALLLGSIRNVRRKQ